MEHKRVIHLDNWDFCLKLKHFFKCLDAKKTRNCISNNICIYIFNNYLLFFIIEEHFIRSIVTVSIHKVSITQKFKEV